MSADLGTRIGVARAADGRVRVDLAGGLLSCRRLPDEHDTVRVALVATQALLLAGDAVRVAVDVADGLALEVVEVTGTVAYDMQGGRATWAVDVALGAGSVLVWDALPFVVASGAHVHRSARLALADGARAVLRETYVLGRTGEPGGHLTTTTHARLAGRPLLVETLTVDPAARADPALLGGARCLDTVTLLGARLDPPTPDVPPGADVLQLDRPGTLVRTFGTAAHTGDLAAVVTRARDAARAAGRRHHRQHGRTEHRHDEHVVAGRADPDGVTAVEVHDRRRPSRTDRHEDERRPAAPHLLTAGRVHPHPASDGATPRPR